MGCAHYWLEANLTQNLREKIEDDLSQPRRLLTRRGEGIPLLTLSILDL
jgi:hypothetical protein